MKRFWYLFPAIVLVACLLVSGCGQSSDQIQVATDATWPPFEYIDTDSGDIVGFDIDLFDAIAERAGLDVQYVNVEWDPLLAGMAQGTYDAAISSITIKADRLEKMNFSDPYYVAGQVIVVRTEDNSITGPATLSGKSVGVQTGTTGDDEVASIAGAEGVGYDEIGMGFIALMNGQIDAVVCDTPVASGYVSKYASLKTVGEVLTTEEYGIAVPKGREDLLAKINEGLAQAKADGVIEQLVQKWLVE